VNIIIAAVVGGLLLLWGGILGLLRMVDMFERKHFLLLGAYTTLVAGSVMGLVLYTNYQRQKEHRQQIQEQMNEFSRRLNELSARLVGQLEEKANLTASEFEIRARLQNEQEHHRRTRAELATKGNEYQALQRKLDAEIQARRLYQEETNQKLEERFRHEDARYRELGEVQRRNFQAVQKQVQDHFNALDNKANTLLGKVNTAREVQDLTTQKIDALARNQASLYDDLTKTMAAVDSLYEWKKK
jgi:chromosome segregation ATPase